MSPTLVPIYGTWGIQSYGFCIALGVLAATYLALHDPRRKKLLTNDQTFSLMSWCIIAGAIGGWLMAVLTGQRTTWEEIVTAGLSILGTIIGIFIFLLFYLRKHRLPLLPILDLCGSYGALVQAFGRVGCFFAGCCYGLPSTVAWAVTYTDSDSYAPTCVPLHPSQLYSAGILFGIFLFIYFYLRHVLKKPGQIMSSYLLLVSIERFSTDYFRTDHGAGMFSVNQYIAMGLGALAMALLGWTSRK